MICSETICFFGGQFRLVVERRREGLMERFFGLITAKQIRRGVFTSVAALEQAIHEFIDQHNVNKKPFVWNKSVAENLEKVGRAREVLSIQQSA